MDHLTHTPPHPEGRRHPSPVKSSCSLDGSHGVRGVGVVRAGSAGSTSSPRWVAHRRSTRSPPTGGSEMIDAIIAVLRAVCSRAVTTQVGASPIGAAGAAGRLPRKKGEPVYVHPATHHVRALRGDRAHGPARRRRDGPVRRRAPTDDERSPYYHRHGRRHDIDPVEAVRRRSARPVNTLSGRRGDPDRGRGRRAGRFRACRCPGRWGNVSSRGCRATCWSPGSGEGGHAFVVPTVMSLIREADCRVPAAKTALAVSLSPCRGRVKNV